MKLKRVIAGILGGLIAGIGAGIARNSFKKDMGVPLMSWNYIIMASILGVLIGIGVSLTKKK